MTYFHICVIHVLLCIMHALILYIIITVIETKNQVVVSNQEVE